MVFEITKEHVAALSDGDLRLLVAYLCEQEIIKNGRSPSAVTYGGDQNSPDGGIDVYVDLGEEGLDGFLPRGQIGFQVKAENFPPKKIKVEMAPEGKLRKSIQDLIAHGGAYIIASSGSSVAHSYLQKRKEAMREIVSPQADSEQLLLDFYDRQRLATWTNQHPGVALWLRKRVGQSLEGWRPFGDWSSSPGDMNETYLVSDAACLNDLRTPGEEPLGIIAGIERIRSVLKEPKGVTRLIGLSGVGKTRLVQALFDKRVGTNPISPQLAIYADVADGLDPTPIGILERLANTKQQCVLVLDNCNPTLHGKLVARLKSTNGQLSLLTVEYDIQDDEPEGTEVFSLEPASDELIEDILKRRYPVLSQPDIKSITSFAGGNFRIALALANTAETGDSLANLRDSDLFERLFHQKKAHDRSLYDTAKACSLVYSFDGETFDGEDAELPILAAIANQSVLEFYENVAILKQRKLVQSRSRWRALLPQAIAHRLAKEALQRTPSHILESQFLDSAPNRLLRSFSRQLGCLHDSPEAQSMVGKWLGAGGWLASVQQLSDLEMEVLQNVAPVLPESVLENIRIAADSDKKVLNTDGVHRDEVLRLLRLLAYDPAHFDKAIKLIHGLIPNGHNENDVAQNTFKSLFFMYLSGTRAPAEQRAHFLRTLLPSTGARGCASLIVGLEAMLECRDFSSSYNYEFGARKRDYGLEPCSWTEILDWYRPAILLVSEAAKLAPYRIQLPRLMASRFCDLVCETRLTDDLALLGNEFARGGGWAEGWVRARKTTRILRHTARRQDFKKLSRFAASIRPKDLFDRIVVYVLPKRWSADDTAMLYFGNESEQKAEELRIKAICEEIAVELSGDLDLLKKFLPTLLGSETSQNRVNLVAELLGNRSMNGNEIWELLAEFIRSNEFNSTAPEFLACFLLGLRASNDEVVESILSKILEEEAFHPHLIRLQARAGLCGKDGYKRLFKAITSNTIPTDTFRFLHQCGGVVDNLTDMQFYGLMKRLAERENGVEVALDSLYVRLIPSLGGQRSTTALEIKLGRELLANLDLRKESRIEDYRLGRVVERCLLKPAGKTVCQKICGDLAQQTLSGILRNVSCKHLVASMASVHPTAVLDVLVETYDLTSTRFWENSGSRGQKIESPLEKIPEPTLMAWADTKPDSRYKLLAGVVRPWDSTGSSGSLQWTSVALKLVENAPVPEDVLETLFQRFSPQYGWTGELSEILRTRVVLLHVLMNMDDDRIVAWASDASNRLNQMVKQAVENARSDYRYRDESFE